MNLFMWNCGIPGKDGTDFAGGVFPVTLEFPEDYPYTPPLCMKLFLPRLPLLISQAAFP